MQAAGTLPKTPLAILATAVESLRSSMTEEMLIEEGERIYHSLCCNVAQCHV